MQHQQQHMLALPKHEQMRSQRNLARKVKPDTRRSRQRPGKLPLAHRRYRQPNIRRRGRKNLLPRHTPTLREDRAQALVSLNDVSQRSRQRRTVQLPAQPNRQRDRVRRSPSLQPLQKPQPALRIRQRNLRRTRLLPQRRPRSPRIPEPLHQSRDRRRLEQAADRDLNIQRRPHPADQTRRKQRMAPKRKEVVVNPNTLDPQHLRKQRAQNLLARRPRQPATHQPRHLRRRQRSTVQLPVRRQRKTIQNHIPRRHHVLGKKPREMPTQLLRRRRTSPSRNHIRHQPLAAPAAVLARNHRGLRNLPMPNQRSLDLPRLDPEPAHLHLRIRTPQKLQHPIRTPARKVPGAVHPAPRRSMRVRNKPLRRQTCSAQIAARQPRSRDVKLPAYPSRDRLKTSVQHVNPRVRYRPPDRNRIVEIGSTGDREASAERRSLGEAIAVDHSAAILCLNDFAHVRRRQNVAACQQLPHTRDRRKMLIDHLMEQRSSQPQDADTGLGDGALQADEVQRAVRIDDQLGSVEQSAPDFEGRSVERKWRQMQKDVVG